MLSPFVKLFLPQHSLHLSVWCRPWICVFTVFVLYRLLGLQPQTLFYGNTLPYEPPWFGTETFCFCFLWVHLPFIPKIQLFGVPRKGWVWKHNRGIEWNKRTWGSKETKWVKLWNFLPWCDLDAKHGISTPISKVLSNAKEHAVPPTHIKNKQKTLSGINGLQTTGYWHNKCHCVLYNFFLGIQYCRLSKQDVLG